MDEVKRPLEFIVPTYGADVLGQQQYGLFQMFDAVKQEQIDMPPGRFVRDC